MPLCVLNRNLVSQNVVFISNLISIKSYRGKPLGVSRPPLPPPPPLRSGRVKHKINNPPANPRYSQGNEKMQFLFLLFQV